jgi:hypothetical protein
MTTAEAIEIAFDVMKSFSVRDVQALKAFGLNDTDLIEAFGEIERYPFAIVEPSRSVLSRAHSIATAGDKIYVDIPFCSNEEGISDLELRLWVGDGPVIANFDILVP